MTLIRSVLFQIAFHGVSAVFFLVYLVIAPFMSRETFWRHGVLYWVHTCLFLLRVIAGTSATFRGSQNIPEGPLLVAAKHQSAWETLALLPHFKDPVFILKKELMSIPLFGFYARKARMIPIDRAAGSGALKDMAERAKAELALGRQILIFPEGTRRPPGAPPQYKFGVAHLYSAFGVPCVPVALNAGLYWPRGEVVRRAGTILVEFLPAIPPGLSRNAFMERITSDIETASDLLLEEGLAALGPRAPDLPARGPKQSPLSTPVENS